MWFVAKESLNCFEKSSHWKSQTAENLLPLWSYFVPIFRGTALMRAVVSWLFYCGSCIRTKKQDERTPSSFLIMLWNAGELPAVCQGKPRPPEDLFYEIPTKTTHKNAALAKGPGPARCRLLLKRNNLTQGYATGFGMEPYAGKHTMQDWSKVQETGTMIRLRFCIKAQVLFKASYYFKHMPKVMKKGHLRQWRRSW